MCQALIDGRLMIGWGTSGYDDGPRSHSQCVTSILCDFAGQLFWWLAHTALCPLRTISSGFIVDLGGGVETAMTWFNYASAIGDVTIHPMIR